MKQTAVEWFQDQIIKIVNGTCELSEIQIFEQAKAMEKEQIQDSHRNGFTGGVRYATNTLDTAHKYMTAEQYYNETYGKDSTGI